MHVSKAIRSFPGQQPGIPPSPLPVLPNARQGRPRSANVGSTVGWSILSKTFLTQPPFSHPCFSSRNTGGALLKNPLPKAAATSFGPFGAGSSHTAGLAVPRLLLSAFGARPLSPIFSLEPSSATLWLRGLFLCLPPLQPRASAWFKPL